jgi:hypothetical protein
MQLLSALQYSLLGQREATEQVPGCWAEASLPHRAPSGPVRSSPTAKLLITRPLERRLVASPYASSSKRSWANTVLLTLTRYLLAYRWVASPSLEGGQVAVLHLHMGVLSHATVAT